MWNVWLYRKGDNHKRLGRVRAEHSIAARKRAWRKWPETAPCRGYELGKAVVRPVRTPNVVPLTEDEQRVAAGLMAAVNQWLKGGKIDASDE